MLINNAVTPKMKLAINNFPQQHFSLKLPWPTVNFWF